MQETIFRTEQQTQMENNEVPQTSEQVQNKSEKQKMIDGDFYNAYDETLVRDRLNCRELLYDFNHSRPSEVNNRVQQLKQLFGSTGNSLTIEPDFKCDYGYNIFVGENFYANFNCVFLDCARIDIGFNVMLAPCVQLYTATHPVDAKLRETQEYAKPIKIGNNVWIGGGAIVGPGVSIGDNTTIGAGSVVTKDIPANVVAVGNPCRVIKHLEIHKQE